MPDVKLNITFFNYSVNMARLAGQLFYPVGSQSDSFGANL